jgi:hypothetical protein
MGTIVPTVEATISQKLPVYLCAVDVDKAYDSVFRPALEQLLNYMGIGHCILVKFILLAMKSGPVTVTGAATLSEFFNTTCGIKQGCPASPTLFCLILAGL